MVRVTALSKDSVRAEYDEKQIDISEGDKFRFRKSLGEISGGDIITIQSIGINRGDILGDETSGSLGEYPARVAPPTGTVIAMEKLAQLVFDGGVEALD